MPSSSNCLINIRFGECIQNFCEEIFVWKTSKKWKENIIIDFKEMGADDGSG
jgi:hypothetical protein